MSLPLSRLGMATRALEVLEQYRAHMAELKADTSAMGIYLDVGSELDQLRALSSIDARLSVPMVQLLIAHTEVLASLWETSKSGCARLQQRAWSSHSAACEFMHERCQELVGRLH